MMDANSYQQQALRTWTPADEAPDAYDADLMYHALQVASEAGEVVGLVAKATKYGAPLIPTELGDECGDLLWHVAVLIDMLGLNLDLVMIRNIQKLEERHPQGDPAAHYQNGGG